MIQPDVVVVGAVPAAGLLAAARAATRGQSTLLLEKNRQPGVKILMSGGTRCNLTHATDARGIVAAYGPPGRFLHSALAALGPSDLVELFHAAGVATKIEATGKVFPVSDRAADVLSALLRMLHASGAQLALAEPVLRLEQGDEGTWTVTTPLRRIHPRRVILTTGGLSYPKSGTSGDGYAWAAALGHTIVAPRPALTPITVEAAWVRELRGITVGDVSLSLFERVDGEPGRLPAARKPLDQRRGSLLFTHFGLSGPVSLDISRTVSGHAQPRRLRLLVDFWPALPEAELDQQLRAACAATGQRQLAHLWPALPLPTRLVEALLRHADLDPQRKAAELTRTQRGQWLAAIKRLSLDVAGTLGFGKAEVTAGGVVLAEVDSKTMHSRRVQGLSLAGEILDLDGPIGGFNFQAAFSTGWLAGEHA